MARDPILPLDWWERKSIDHSFSAVLSLTYLLSRVRNGQPCLPLRQVAKDRKRGRKWQVEEWASSACSLKFHQETILAWLFRWKSCHIFQRIPKRGRQRHRRSLRPEEGFLSTNRQPDGNKVNRIFSRNIFSRQANPARTLPSWKQVNVLARVTFWGLWYCSFHRLNRITWEF